MLIIWCGYDWLVAAIVFGLADIATFSLRTRGRCCSAVEAHLVGPDCQGFNLDVRN
jgi:hypothetical protein